MIQTLILSVITGAICTAIWLYLYERWKKGKINFNKSFVIIMSNGDLFAKGEVLISGSLNQQFKVIKIYKPAEPGTFKYWWNKHMPKSWAFREKGIRLKKIKRPKSYETIL